VPTLSIHTPSSSNLREHASKHCLTGATLSYCVPKTQRHDSNYCYNITGRVNCTMHEKESPLLAGNPHESDFCIKGLNLPESVLHIPALVVARLAFALKDTLRQGDAYCFFQILSRIFPFLPKWRSRARFSMNAPDRPGALTGTHYCALSLLLIHWPRRCSIESHSQVTNLRQVS
jgi:hypothetical protein